MRTKILITAILFILSVVKINSQPITLNENNIKFEAPQTAILVGQDGLAMRTVDGGDTWTVLATNVTNNLKSNDFYSYLDNGVEQRIHLAVGENGLILKSVDDGTTWEAKTSGTTEHLNDVFILTRMLTVACGDNGTLLYSSDFGESWVIVPTNSTENFASVIFIEGENQNISREQYLIELRGIVTGSNGTILVSKGINGGFVPAQTGTTEKINSVFYAGANIVFAAGNTGTILQSTDKGENWVPVVSGTTENINKIKFLDNGSTAVASCDNGVILNSQDAGATWTVVPTNTTNDLFAVSFSSAAFGITVGEGGTELYSTDAGLTWINKEETQMVASSKNAPDVNLMQNYPNPFNPSTIISYSLPFDAQVSVKIYDMLGKEVRTLVSTQQNSGTYNVSFNASNMASGIYFYVLRASSGSNEMTKTMKMILTK